MELRHSATMDNSAVPQPSPSKQPRASPNPVDTTSVSQRLQKELMSLMLSGGDLGVSAFPEGESIFAWIGTIEGGKGTVYEGLSYKLSLRFPLDYPFKPPQVKFETMCFHPNVDQFGNICLDILQLLLDKVDTILHLFCNRTTGLQPMIAELFFCPSRVSWESPTMRVLLTAMLQHYGKTRKITGKWYRSSIFLVKQLKANS